MVLSSSSVLAEVTKSNPYYYVQRQLLFVAVGLVGSWVVARLSPRTLRFLAWPALLVAAVSVGVVQGTPLLDLEYVEDVACDTDMNIVMTGAGGFVEVQGTAEGAPFTRAELDSLLALADQGIRQLVAAQRQALGLA